MTEVQSAFVIVLVVIPSVACLALAGWLLRTYARETMRMIQQADERVSASWCFAEKSMSRLMATAFPNSHKVFRSEAGPTFDGTQQRVKPAYLDGVMPEEAAKKMAEAEQMMAEAKLYRQQAKAAVHGPEELEVGTPLDFEQGPNGVGR